MNNTTQLASLHPGHGHETARGFDFRSFFKELVERREAEACIISTEEGFSPLGASRDFFERDLGISYEDEIEPFANWNRFENERTTLVALESRRPVSLLLGIILAPGETSLCYERLPASVRCHRPCRDFYYNVTYEALAVACGQWGARKIAISHLSGSGRYHEDIATCHAEALAHYCDGHPDSAPDSFAFCGCCITPEHLQGIQRLSAEEQSSKHRPIQITTETKAGATLLHLDWF